MSHNHISRNRRGVRYPTLKKRVSSCGHLVSLWPFFPALDHSLLSLITLLCFFCVSHLYPLSVRQFASFFIAQLGTQYGSSAPFALWTPGTMGKLPPLIIIRVTFVFLSQVF